MNKNRFVEAVEMALLLAVSIIFIFPFYWIATGSFKLQLSAIAKVPEWYPHHPTLENYYRLIFKNPSLSWLFNSIFQAVAVMILVCLISTLAGYVLAKKRFIGKTVLFTIFIFAMALPKQVILVPLVRLVSFLHIHDTHWAIILPALGWPFGVFLMKQFSETIPGDLLEAAKIDGCGELRTFFSIVLPIVKPGFAALAIFTFINTWNDYFMQLVMLFSRRNLTLPLGVATLQQEFASNYGLIMAGAALASLPIILIFILFQKSFTQGITMGAVKG